MKRLCDEAYVLSTHDLGEADLIVSLFAERAGRVRGVAPRARGSRRRFGGALAPLTHVRASWLEREGRELHRIERLETIESHATMQSDPEVQAACAVIAELATATAREGQGDSRFFRLIGAVLRALGERLHPLLAVRYFELWCLKLNGVLADLSACASCGEPFGDRARRWAAAGQGLLCRRCRDAAEAPPRLLKPAERAFLEAALAGPPLSLAGMREAAAPGGALETLLRGSVRWFTERGIRSYRHLDRVAEPSRGYDA